MVESVRVRLDDKNVDCQVYTFRGFVVEYNITGDIALHLKPWFKGYGTDELPLCIRKLFENHILNFSYENEPKLDIMYNGLIHTLEWGDVILRYKNSVGNLIYRPMRQCDYESSIVDDDIPLVMFD